MKVKSQKDFVSGLLFTCIGGAFAWGATNYTIGIGARMGPGYFPLLLGVMLAILGCGITIRAMIIDTVDGEKIGSAAWKPLIFIISANLIFGVLLGGLPSIGIPPFGLVAAIFALTLVACLAGDDFNIKEVLVLATVLSVMSYVAFVVLLKLQFPVWPSFITG